MDFRLNKAAIFPLSALDYIIDLIDKLILFIGFYAIVYYSNNVNCSVTPHFKE